MTGYRVFLSVLGMVVLFAIAIVATEAAQWAGADSGCVAQRDCYCEAFRDDGFAAQPINTASNLGFVVVGLVILWSTRNVARLTLSMAFGGVAVGLGIGSALFHATLTGWGGWADLVSMYCFISLYIAVNLAELRRWQPSTTLLSFGTLAGALAALQVPLEQGNGKFVFIGLVAVALATEIRLRDVRSDHRWLLAALIVLGASFVVWNLSRTGAAWCDPGSVLQGHAVWHLGAAATVALLYRHLAQTLVKM